MAVDTATERKAFIGLLSRGTVPSPNSSLDESDRALLAGFFTGDTGVEEPPPEEPPPDPPPPPGPTSLFSPPVHFVGPRLTHRSWGPERWYFRRASALPVGRSVLKIDGVYVTIDTPTQAQIDSATEYYAGGHVYTVDAATAEALTAAGYGANLS